jgi:transglutaminase-like putative cysteine protease
LARTALLFVPVAFLVTLAWGRLDDRSDAPLLVLAALALLPALLPSWRTRAAAAVVAALVAARVATGLSPLDARPFHERDYVGPLLDRVRDGILAFYDVSVPFAVAERPEMGDAIELAVFGFCLLAAIGLALRRPLLAAGAAAGGTAWPVTLLGGGEVAWGIAVLGVALLILAVGGERRPHRFRPAVAAGAVLVVASLAATASPAVAKTEFLGWQGWDPYDKPANPVGVRYVWDANYGGIRFPDKSTEVLRITGPERRQHWRATTLDVFDGTRWREDLRFIHGSDGPVRLVSDPFLPRRALNESEWVQADVEVGALRDTRLAGPATPVRLDPRGIGFVEYSAGNVAVLPAGLQRGQRYRVWSYSPRPTPRQLGRVRPTALRRNTLEQPYLQVGPDRNVLPFGTPDREEQLATLLEHYPAYRPLVAQALELAGDAPNQYAAVVALETWFRRAGGFAYDEQPPVSRDAPPLVGFVVDGKRGYCQHFAGAMALMLRFLGVPARVAAGFTGGSYDEEDHRWTVRDTDAHTWVEVWFNGWGWLPFDPTPGRGQLSGTYSTASPTLDVDGLSGAFGGGSGNAVTSELLRDLRRAQLEGTGRDVPGDLPVGAVDRIGGGDSLLRLLALVAAALAAGISLAKLVRRRLRYLTRDPRRVAGACRNELADYLRDQRVVVARSATLGELGEAVRSQLGVDAAPFVRAAGIARFAPPAQAARAAHEARRELRRLLRRLGAGLSAFDRVRGLLSVRSLGLGA